MTFRDSATRTLVVGCALAGMVLTPGRALATTFDVNAGSQLFQTVSGSAVFGGVPFVGVPLGTFDFGGSIGVQNVGNTDTIVQRLAPAIAPGKLPGAVQVAPVLLMAMQLETAAPTTVFGSLDNYFLTLLLLSSGSELFTWDASGLGGTFTSSFTGVFLNLREGSLTGPIVQTLVLDITNDPSWSDVPPAGALTIPGVNQFLAGGSDPTQDFWPSGAFAPIYDGAPFLRVIEDTQATAAAVPEPATLTLTALGLAGIVRRARRRRAAR